MLKIIAKSKFIKPRKRVDTLVERKKKLGNQKQDLQLLERCERVWNSLSPMRANRRRNFRYVFDDQWGDMVWDGKKYVTERSRIAKKTGGVVLQNNHLFKIVNSIIGVYTKAETKPTCFAREENADTKSQMMTNALQTNYDNNEMNQIFQSAMMEMICGGIPIVSEEWSPQDGEFDAHTYPISPDYFFFESKGNDPRLAWDTCLVGDFRDFLPSELVAELSRYGVYTTTEEVTKHFRLSDTDYINDFNTNRREHIQWKYPEESRYCRVFYVWTHEYRTRIRCYDPLDQNQPVFKVEVGDIPEIEAMNAARITEAMLKGIPVEEVPVINYGQFGEDDEDAALRNLGEVSDDVWHFQMLDTEGYVLVEFDSPYKHGSHPYTFTAHHYVNGKIYPFISVIIDQQRYINRLITLHDMAINASAKGIKMIPKSVLGGMSPKAFAEQFTEIGGFIFYTPDPKNPYAKPEVITNNTTNIGTADLLKLEVEFISDITSVSGALQGKTPSSGTAASRYAMEMQNSTTSISSLFSRFTGFETNVAKKKLEVIHQFYKDPRNISVRHTGGYAEYNTYDPIAVKDIKFQVRVEQSAETPVARMALNQFLEEQVNQGRLGIRELLKYGYIPGADKLLLELDAQQAQQQQMAAAQGGAPIPEGAPAIEGMEGVQGPRISPESMQQINNNANAQAVDSVRQILMS